jgi:SPP1 family predicted phage head-tail adaptor
MQKFKYRPRLNNGNLRHRITFQVQTETQNDYGEEIKEWVDVVTVWASIKPISAKEFFAAEKTNSEVSHKINMRYNHELKITPDMRIKFNDRSFELIGPPINFQERNIELQLLCKELF